MRFLEPEFPVISLPTAQDHRAAGLGGLLEVWANLSNRFRLPLHKERIEVFVLHRYYDV